MSSSKKKNIFFSKGWIVIEDYDSLLFNNYKTNLEYITMGYKEKMVKTEENGKNIVWKIDDYNYSPLKPRIDILQSEDYIKEYKKNNPHSKKFKNILVHNLYHWIGSKHWENYKWNKKDSKLMLYRHIKKKPIKK